MASAVVFARFGPRIEMMAPGVRLVSSRNDAALTTRMLGVLACKSCHPNTNVIASFFTVPSPPTASKDPNFAFRKNCNWTSRFLANPSGNINLFLSVSSVMMMLPDRNSEVSMLTRRGFAGIGLATLAGRMLPEVAYAQRAAVQGTLPNDMVWLNANENPDGPPASSIAAMTNVVPESWRYHYQEFGAFYAALAHGEDLAPEQILVGSGSSEILHAAVEAFSSATRPLITVAPTYEGPVDVAAASGHTVVRIPLEPPYVPDLRKLVAEAGKAGGGLIYLCNPNNPTSTVVPKKDLAWMISNLPPNTVALIDEAYIHFGDSPELESAL